MMRYFLQMCSRGRSFDERMLSFDFVEAITCQYADPLGMGLFAMIVYTGISGSIYIRTGSTILPLGLLLLGGGAFVGQLVGVATPYVVAMLLLIPAGVTAYIYQRFST